MAYNRKGLYLKGYLNAIEHNGYVSKNQLEHLISKIEEVIGYTYFGGDTEDTYLVNGLVNKHISDNSEDFLDFMYLKELDKLNYLIKRLKFLRKRSDLNPLDLFFLSELAIETESFFEKNRPEIDEEFAEVMFNTSQQDPNDRYEFCQACQENPCMCSDREKTSTIHDF